ncbi:NADPH-dependent FMN reductase [Fluviicola chungangensis]|uniref:NAD(P)H-dependent oxidoreductase n=1 Tax=Fluviicola chungangensis TaxID=2597671 RepID=A0A556N6E0_9FLAO|nr:NADPH-dependent FMN reductase [Fluviicola chungangensis]TSJ47752.1 NAD(P)H-dependent oxidoreductase [Fluviicola chungangensis]
MKTILAIIGSASESSSNRQLVEFLAASTKIEFNWIVFNELKSLPHFDPELSVNNTPQEIVAFRALIDQADGVIICTPEYVFSIPSGLKNAIEWCVSTTIFSNKPCGLITASAQGEKGHEELQLLMKTLMAQFTDETALLISGIKGKIQQDNINPQTRYELERFLTSFTSLLALSDNLGDF